VVASKLEPHLLTFYLLDLATALHDYYTKHRFLGEEEALTGPVWYWPEASNRSWPKGLSFWEYLLQRGCKWPRTRRNVSNFSWESRGSFSLWGF
jgi:hypothetical protein